MSPRAIVFILLLASLLALPSIGSAEPVKVSILNARYDATGTGLSVTASPRTLELLQAGGGFTFYLVDRPFVLYDDSSGRREAWSVVVQSQVMIDVHAAIGFKFVDIGLVLPIAPVIVWGLDPTGDFPVLEGGDTGGIGDLVVIPKVMIINPREKVFGLGVQVPISFPTGHAARYLGSGGLGLELQILAEVDLGRFRALVNVAPLHLRPRVEYAGFVRQVGMNWSVGVSASVLRTMDLRAETWGTMSYMGTTGRTTAEWSASVALRPTDFVGLELGAGGGIAGFGTPQLRAFAGVRFTAPSKAPMDEEGPSPEPAPEPAAEPEPEAEPTEEAAPETDEAAPETEEAAPAPDEAAPTGDEAAPTADETAPAADQAAPAGEEAAPATEEAAPESEEAAPESDEAAPASDEAAPESEDAAPESEEAPATEDAAPESDEAAPAPEGSAE